MRLQVLSDIHLEVCDYKYVPCEDVFAIILAGDISSNLSHRRPFEKFVEFIESILRCNKPVLFVAGNHEYYGSEWEDVNRLISELHLPGFYFLNNKSVTLGGVTFIGTTLWSNVRDEEKLTISRSIRDYQFIEYACRKLTIDDSTRLFNDNVNFLERELAEKGNTAKVVITHHLPSYKSIHEVYKYGRTNSAFASDLEELIIRTCPLLWVHGHSHRSCDYMLGQTRVMSNPRGYFRNYQPENTMFEDIKVVEIFKNKPN